MAAWTTIKYYREKPCVIAVTSNAVTESGIVQLICGIPWSVDALLAEDC